MFWSHRVLAFPLKYESRVCETELVDLLALCLLRGLGGGNLRMQPGVGLGTPISLWSLIYCLSETFLGILEIYTKAT